MKKILYNYVFYPLAVFTGALTLLLSGCEKDEIPSGEVTPVIPVVSSMDPANVLVTMADCGGEVTDDGGGEITARGVVWGTTPLPTVDLTTKTNEGSGTGKFVSKVTGLLPGTTYYFRAYATNSAGTGYGGVTSKNFVTRPFPPGITGLVADASGNFYQTVVIGTRTWMVENLKTTKFRDGTNITNVSDDSQWGLLTTAAYCNYRNEVKNGDIYGRLYNWHSVNDAKGLCPAGWHVPTDVEWTALMDYAGGRTVAGGKLKQSGSTHWYGANVFGTNEFGFTAMPGDFRPSNGIYVYHLFNSCYFWTSTPVSPTSTTAYYNWLPYSDKIVTRASTDKKTGYSVRCIKDI
ncbi:MAG TPA: hypothetical protein DEO54_06765 [Rikenellaceae bacterium]|nr:hypothetical protein [Rikenellaceae bacterium]